MKKTIFKGTINGKNFDSVEDYNKEITRAIAAGESIQANSETSTVDEDEHEFSRCAIPCPGFEWDDEYYLDKYVTGDSDKDEILCHEANECVEKMLPEIIDKIGTVSDKDLEFYAEYVNNILYNITEDRMNNEEVLDNIGTEIKSLKDQIRKIEEKIKEQEAQKSVCMNAVKIMNLFDKSYDFIYDKVDQEISKREKCCCKCECEGKCECNDEKCCSCEEQTPKEEKTTHVQKSLEESIKNLIKEIFK